MHACPSLEYLEQLLAGALGGPDFATLAEHIAGCSSCDALLDRLADDLDQAVHLRDRQSPVEHVRDPHLTGLDAPLRELEKARHRAAAYNAAGQIRPTSFAPDAFVFDNSQSRWRVQVGARLKF